MRVRLFTRQNGLGLDKTGRLHTLMSVRVVGVLKVEYLDFPCEIFEILCELDVGEKSLIVQFLECHRPIKHN